VEKENREGPHKYSFSKMERKPTKVDLLDNKTSINFIFYIYFLVLHFHYTFILLCLQLPNGIKYKHDVINIQSGQQQLQGALWSQIFDLQGFKILII
jgi:hypothetical protein